MISIASCCDGDHLPAPIFRRGSLPLTYGGLQAHIPNVMTEVSGSRVVRTALRRHFEPNRHDITRILPDLVAVSLPKVAVTLPCGRVAGQVPRMAGA